MKKRLVLIVAIVAVLAGTVGYASNAYSQQLTVYYGTVKRIIIDGIDKTPAEKMPFIYEGTTYVPIRYVSESMGKDVSWDGSTGTIYIGKNPEEADYLTDKAIYAHENIYFYRIDNSMDDSKQWDSDYFPYTMTMAGEEYAKGVTIRSRSYNNESYIVYNLNGQYEKLSGLVGYEDMYMNESYKNTLNFYVDDKLVETIILERGSLPEKIDIDLDFGMQLKITNISDRSGADYINYVNMILD